MSYEGKGDMKSFVAEWNKAISALKNTVVIQKEFVGSPAALTFTEKGFVLDFT